MSAVPVLEACYCGTRWSVDERDTRTCTHCDRPPAVKIPYRLTDGTVTYRYECPPKCPQCATVYRRTWPR